MPEATGRANSPRPGVRQMRSMRGSTVFQFEHKEKMRTMKEERVRRIFKKGKWRCGPARATLLDSFTYN